jgi:hypothetical protein
MLEVVVSELRFHFDEMHREIKDFYGLAKPFLDPGAEACLDTFAGLLLTIRSKAPLANNPPAVLNKQYRWDIPGHLPLVTRPSRSYERGGRQGGMEIVGRLTAVWEITPDPRRSKQDAPKQFRLTGNASVIVEWLDTASYKTVAQWNMDVADAAAPGCMFHVQVPSPVPVPRLPCIAFTPVAVAEFVLGELFQDAWENHTRTTSCENWSATQKRRLSRLLAWQQQVVAGCAGPPWTALKRERLPHDRFVSTK